MAKYVYNGFMKPWIAVEIRTSTHHKTVHIHSSIHVKNEFKVPHSYSVEFSNSQILRDEDLLKYVRRYL